jgi:hypothetical protein
MKLFVDVVDMEPNGADGDAAGIGDHLVAVAFNKAFQDVELPGGQGVIIIF